MGETGALTVGIATQADIPKYVHLAQAAQAFLQSEGLAQWVPAAHTTFLPRIAAKVKSRSLHKVCCGDKAIAFFDHSFEPSEWWSTSTESAGYISGIVVSRAARGLGVGSFILEWAAAQTRAAGAQYLRLDCHADNPWLCAYYCSKGFTEVDRVEQYPGYIGSLRQKLVSSELA